MTLCSQAWGYFLGTVTPMKVISTKRNNKNVTNCLQIAVFLGPVLICAFSVFGFCMSYEETPFILKWVYELSYFRAGFHSIAHIVMGMGRKTLPCPEDVEYCHYVNPIKFMHDMGIGDVDLVANIYLIVIMTTLLYLLTYGALWFKLNIR